MPNRKIYFPSVEETSVPFIQEFDMKQINFCTLPKLICSHGKIISPAAWLAIGFTNCPFCGIVFDHN